ncbi:hypothetical protein D3C81_1495400 [compost metagenome]
MVLIVVDAHRLLVDVRLQCVIRVRQRRKRMPADWDGTLRYTRCGFFSVVVRSRFLAKRCIFLHGFRLEVLLRSIVGVLSV